MTKKFNYADYVPKNVIGTPLEACCYEPMTGFFRDGFCNTDARDIGKHTVCVEITDAFLEFSKSKGNDLSTPRPEYGFDGLVQGDRWCLCVERWKEALNEGVAPKVLLNSCHEEALNTVSLEDLLAHAIHAHH